MQIFNRLSIVPLFFRESRFVYKGPEGAPNAPEAAEGGVAKPPTEGGDPVRDAKNEGRRLWKAAQAQGQGLEAMGRFVDAQLHEAETGKPADLNAILRDAGADIAGAAENLERAINTLPDKDMAKELLAEADRGVKEIREAGGKEALIVQFLDATRTDVQQERGRAKREGDEMDDSKIIDAMRTMAGFMSGKPAEPDSSATVRVAGR